MGWRDWFKLDEQTPEEQEAGEAFATGVALGMPGAMINPDGSEYTKDAPGYTTAPKAAGDDPEDVGDGAGSSPEAGR